MGTFDSTCLDFQTSGIRLTESRDQSTDMNLRIITSVVITMVEVGIIWSVSTMSYDLRSLLDVSTIEFPTNYIRCLNSLDSTSNDSDVHLIGTLGAIRKT